MGTNNSIVQRSIERAIVLMNSSSKLPSTKFLDQIKPLLAEQANKFFLIKLLDTSLRPNAATSINQHILNLFGQYPTYTSLFNTIERGLIWLYKTIGKSFPSLSIPLIEDKIKSSTKDVIFETQSTHFKKVKLKRAKQNIKQNINLIGEALLGEEEALERIQAYKKLINSPDINYISIKISTIFSQISSLAFKETIERLKPKLRSLYQECLKVEKETGKVTFINLDMEEYRDLSITVELFTQVLSEEEFRNYYAGIVLQAYIPDSYRYLITLQAWAEERVKQGGSPIKIRIVKGANMEMEKLEASIKGWELVTHSNKLATDAQYKKMVLESLTPEQCKSVKIGIASHNIFDIALAVELVHEHKLHQDIDFEMLEGLAENTIPGLQDEKVNLLLYTPIIQKEQFLSGMAYLVRRFDEATAKGNFIRESVGMKVNDDSWELLKTQFIDSFNHIDHLELVPKRQQNRNDARFTVSDKFKNSIDTDWTLEQNRNWSESIKLKWKNPSPLLPSSFPEYHDQQKREVFQQNSWSGTLPWTINLATLQDYEKAIETSLKSSWLNLSIEERTNTLRKAGRLLEENRGDLIGIGMAEVGKLITELDPEVSEAVDFANYYASSIEELAKNENYELSPQGVSLVLSPWNFPIAIPAGGIFASLAVGNPVIIKPAKQSIACTYVLCKLLWKAGIPKDALHFLPTHSSTLGPLMSNPSPFSSVILTGGTDTAKSLLKTNPHLPLNAETGGKNATIVTSFADRDLAIKHVVDSAFGNSGQKCSATSLLILEKEVYEDEHFMNLLQDATKSKKVGTPWDLDTQIGPLANPVDGHLQHELGNLETDWLLKSKRLNSHLLTPSIAKNVTTKDSCFQNELFGPLLSIVKAENLEEAISIANQTNYGLTSGLESLNVEEIELWKSKIDAGNLYINRSTTGAIVQRQPFGGIKQSSFGQGRKAGGKHYLTQFLKIESKIPQEEAYAHAETDYSKWYEEYFSKETDEANIRGQANSVRYLRPKEVLLLLTPGVNENQFALIVLACKTLKLQLSVYSTSSVDFLHSSEYTLIDNWNTLLPNINHKVRLRTVDKSHLSEDFIIRLHEQGIHIYDSQPLPFGRFELLNYLQEQSISYDYHRYGNLMDYTS